MRVRRLALHVAAACLVVGVAQSRVVQAAEPGPVSIRAGEHADFGRLVFDWQGAEGDRVGYLARIEDGELVVSFDRRFEADMSVVPRVLDGYVSGMQRGSDGKSVRFRLKGRYRLRQARYGSAIAVDLLGKQAKSEAKTKSGRGRSKMPRVKVRFGDHPGYSRIVFDWPAAVGYSVTTRAGKVIIRFDRAARLNFDGFDFEQPDYIRTARQGKGAKGTVAELAIPKGAGIRHFRSGSRVAIDITAPTGDGDQAGRVLALPKVDDDGVAPAAAPRTAVTVTPEPPRSEPEPAAGPDGGVPAAAAPAAAAPAAIAPAAVSPAAAAAGPLVVGAEHVGDGLRLVFPWAEPVATAVLHRAGHVWVVFDRPRMADLGGLAGGLSGRVGLAEQLPSRRATVLRFRFHPALQPTVRREVGGWIVDMTAMPGPAADPILVEPQPTAAQGARVFLPVLATGRPHLIEDPEVGDSLIFVPVSAAGRGVGGRRRFVQFTVLRTAQGVVVRPKSPGVIVHPEAAGVAVTTAQGMVLSVAPREPKAPPPGRDGGLFRYADWAKGPSARFVASKQALLRAVTAAEASKRNRERFDLARFYFAHEQAGEALGVLARMFDANPRIAELPEFRALRGAALVMLGRPDEAEADLFRSDLDGDADVALWRGMLAAAQERWDAAEREFGVGAAALSGMPPEWRGRFRLAMIDAGLANHSLNKVRPQVAELRKENGSRSDRAWTIYAKARLDRETGAYAEALAGYDALIDGGHRPTRVRSKLDRIKLLRETGEMPVDEAIDKVEGLRFAWRGDAFELEVLETLGRLYIEAGRFREGLSVMRQAVAYFPETDRGRAIARNMNQLFAGLFLDGKADAMDAITALGLYYDFRELTPVGAKGDRMIRRLADRLVDVDLLPRAAELLAHQVNFRVKGQKKAKVATRLAVIHLLDHQPDLALNVLRASKWPGLPPALAAERRYLEARALGEMGQFDEALQLLAGDQQEKARLLRADIYWRAKDWARAAPSFKALLGERWKREQPLNAQERQQVMQLAISLALGENRGALAEVRRRYQPKLEGLPEADALQVIAESEVDPSRTSFRKLAGEIAQVNRLEAFMASYREQLRREARANIN